MGIFFPGNWPVVAIEMFWMVMLGAIVIIAIILLCLFLFPTPIERFRQTTAQRLQDSQHGVGNEAIEAALRRRRSYGHQHATIEWSRGLTQREIKRLDKDSAARVMIVRYFAVDPQEMQARLDFLDTASWWSYRKFAWGQLRWRDAQTTSIMLIVIALFAAYVGALQAAA